MASAGYPQHCVEAISCLPLASSVGEKPAESPMLAKLSDRSESSPAENGDTDDVLSNVSTADDMSQGTPISGSQRKADSGASGGAFGDQGLSSGGRSRSSVSSLEAELPQISILPPALKSSLMGSLQEPRRPSRLLSDVTEATKEEDQAADATSFALPLPGVPPRRVRMRLPESEEEAEKEGGSGGTGDSTATPQAAVRRINSFKLATPSSCTSGAYRYALTPTTPDPARAGFKLVGAEVQIHVIFFDFDGTLTETPGDAVTHRLEKKLQLRGRAGLLAPRLQALRDAHMMLGIISKSTENTIRDALQDAGLEQFFDGPVLGKAVGFEGKAGFIRDLCESGEVGLVSEDDLEGVLLIDDDVRELEQAKRAGIRTFAAPADGGLQDADFDELFAHLGLAAPLTALSMSPGAAFGLRKVPPPPVLGQQTRLGHQQRFSKESQNPSDEQHSRASHQSSLDDGRGSPAKEQQQQQQQQRLQRRESKDERQQPHQEQYEQWEQQEQSEHDRRQRSPAGQGPSPVALCPSPPRRLPGDAKSSLLPLSPGGFSDGA